MSMWKREGEHYSAENVGINAVRHEKHSKEYCKQYLSEETFPKSIGKTIIPKTCGEGTTYSRGVSEKKKTYAKNSTECGIVNPTISNNKPTVWGWVVLPFIYANIIGNSWWLILPQVIGYGLYYGPRNGWSSFPYVLPLLLAVQNLKKTARLHIACGWLSKCWSPQAVLFRILVGAHIFGAFFFWAEFRYDLTHHFLPGRVNSAHASRLSLDCSPGNKILEGAFQTGPM